MAASSHVVTFEGSQLVPIVNTRPSPDATNTMPSSITGLPKPSAPRSNDRRGPHVGFGQVAGNNQSVPSSPAIATCPEPTPGGAGDPSANAPPGTNVPVQVG